MQVRKEDSRKPILSASPCLFVRRRSAWRRSIQSDGVQQSNFYERSVVQVNVRIGFSAPVFERRVRARQLRTPDLITVVGVFHGLNGPRMAPHLNENGFEPALGFRVLEVMVSDPEHQPLPFLCSSTGLLCWRFEPGVQVPRATTFQPMYNLWGRFCSPFQRLSCPVGKRLTVHVTSSSLVEAIRMHQLRRCPGLALSGCQMSSLVTLRRHAFPLLERRILDRFGFLPLLGALRPAHFGSLVARVSYGVIRTCEERAFLLGQAKDVILDPIFQAEDQRPGLDCFGRERFFRFKKSRTAVLENLG